MTRFGEPTVLPSAFERPERRRAARAGLLLLLAGLLGAAWAIGGGAAEASARALHITLDRTIPATDSTVVGPISQVRLFFSGPPLLRGASVRVMNSGRSLMRSSPPAADPEDLTQVFVNMDPVLEAGAYVVQWRVIADDGHVMRGDFSFQVTEE